MEELSLELSIGGKYGKAEDLKEKTSSTEFCGGKARIVRGEAVSLFRDVIFPGWRRWIRGVEEERDSGFAKTGSAEEERRKGEEIERGEWCGICGR